LAERSADLARLGRSLPGADAYLLQPLDEQKLLGRLAEMVASPGEDHAGLAPAALRIEGCRFNLPGRTFLHADGREVALTRAEAALLVAFVRNPGPRVVARSIKSGDSPGMARSCMAAASICTSAGCGERSSRTQRRRGSSSRCQVPATNLLQVYETVDENRESPAAVEPGEQMEAAPERARGPPRQTCRIPGPRDAS